MENPSLQRERNCLGDRGGPALEFSGRVFYECPARLLLREPWVLDAWNDYVMLERFGLPPRSGGTDQMPNRAVQALLLVAGELDRIEREKRAEERECESTGN